LPPCCTPSHLPAQTAAAAPEAKTPGATPQAAPVSEWQKEYNARLLTDFPWLAKFKEADLKLAPPAAGENRVVFMGDSITEGWKIDGPDGSFPASRTSIAASADRPRRRCWCASART
jgi:hypothetical protein